MIKNKAFWRQIIAYTLYTGVLSLLQVTLPVSVALWGRRPDLTLVLAVLAGYMFGSADGFVIGLAAGLMRDMLAGRALGLGMLILMYFGLAASVLLRKFFKRNIVFGLVQIAFFTVVYEFIIVLITFLVPTLADLPYSLQFLMYRLPQILPGQILVNMAAGVPLIFLLAWLGPYKRSNRGDDPDETIMGDSLWHVA
jgi:rod shape-determining protein MreD